jgi:hypothetical protein
VSERFRRNEERRRMSQKNKIKVAATSKTDVPAVPKGSKKMSAEERAALPVTDPRRRLTSEERKALTPDQRKARKAAILARRGPAKGRFHKLVLRMHKRAAQIAARLDGSGDAAQDASGAAHALKQLAGAIDALPADWKPAAGKGAARAPKFEPGTMVQIKKELRERYTDLIPADELDGLVVVACKGSEALVRAEGGTKLFVPSKNLEATAS